MAPEFGLGNDADRDHDFPPSTLHSRRLSELHTVLQQVVCLKSIMRFGQTDLDGSNVKLFVKALLSRWLLKLYPLLEDLQKVTSRLWHKDWAQQTNILKAWRTSTGFILDRLPVLIGQVR